MSHCTSCGRESPPSYQFCLNCGTRLRPEAASAAGLTPALSTPLPGELECQHCGTRNARGMHYCSHCGRAIGLPTLAAGATPTPAGNGLAAAPTPVAPSPSGPALGPSPASAAAPEPERACPHCGGLTPIGYRFCQRCGKAMPAPHAGPAPAAPQAPVAGPDSGASARSSRWGTLVCLNRDGSQGAEYPLTGESVDIGAEATIRFADAFLAPRHLRLEHQSRSVTMTPLERANGVFVRIDEPVELGDSMLLLLGRELLRFDRLGDEERLVTPAVQHGVRIFGSPVREAWGRLSQLLPDACVRDVRYLVGAEVIIGREEGDVVFGDDEFLSRRHASLHWRDGRCVLQDLGSSNGSFIRAGGRTVLRHGAQLRFGDQMVRIDLAA